EGIRTAFAVTAPYPHGQVIDRMAAAQAAGGRYARGRTQEGLVAGVAGWGVARKALASTIDLGPFLDPPFHALELQPAITFPFGGLMVDPDGRVLDRDGGPVSGLFAAGADAGGLQYVRYVGGLALGLVFGPRAARTAINEVGNG